MLPTDVTSDIFLIVCATFLLTGLVQLTWRIFTKRLITGVLAPAAWRTIPFILLVWYVH
jgi:hypothetical protein